MPDNKRQQTLILCVVGVIPVIWLALLAAPAMSGGLVEIIRQLSTAIEHPLTISWCENTTKTVLIFIAIYAVGIGIFFSSARNYRKREEHGSAKWGDAHSMHKKYRSEDSFGSKILTQRVQIGLNGRKHRRNLNVLVVGGSGAGKTRFYAKPNVMQANSSFIICDPKG